jgi:hypothetical protein
MEGTIRAKCECEPNAKRHKNVEKLGEVRKIEDGDFDLDVVSTHVLKRYCRARCPRKFINNDGRRTKHEFARTPYFESFC